MSTASATQVRHVASRHSSPSPSSSVTQSADEADAHTVKHNGRGDAQARDGVEHIDLEIHAHPQRDQETLNNLPEGVDDINSISNRPPTPVSIEATHRDGKQGPTRVLSTDPEKPYSAFTQSTKYMIVSISGVAGILSPISSNIFVPAIPTLASEFNRSEQDISLAVTVYLIFQAITPSFFGAMSDSFGRRPVYIGTLIIYLGANIGLALMPTSAYWLLLFLRALQSSGGSAVIAIGSGCVADIAEPRERGKYNSFFLIGTMAGPALGPLIGGVLADTLGWRSIFWFLTILTGVVLVALIFFIPETLRSLVGDGSIPPPPLSMSPPMLLKKRKMDKKLRAEGKEIEHIERPPPKKYKPWASFAILATPELLIGFVAVSFIYLEFYCVLTLYSTALRDSYGLSDLFIGLAYLSNGLGIFVSVLFTGRYIDYCFRMEEKRVGGDYRQRGDDFRIEWTRFRSIIPSASVFLVGCIAQGWCLQAPAPLGVTIFVGFFVGLGSSTVNIAQVYGQDILPGQGGAVSASLNLVRCLFGAVGTAVIQLLYNSIGSGWTSVLLTGMCIAAFPLYWVIAHYGPKWRATRRAKKEARLERKKRKEEARGIEGPGNKERSQGA